eukprot:110191_1
MFKPTVSKMIKRKYLPPSFAQLYNDRVMHNSGLDSIHADNHVRPPCQVGAWSDKDKKESKRLIMEWLTKNNIRHLHQTLFEHGFVDLYSVKNITLDEIRLKLSLNFITKKDHKDVLHLLKSIKKLKIPDGYVEKYHPKSTKFRNYRDCNDQQHEQSFSKWGKHLKHSLTHASEHTAWWRTYIYQQIRNELMEMQMLKKNQLIRCGVHNGKGFIVTFPEVFVANAIDD